VDAEFKALTLQVLRLRLCSKTFAVKYSRH
jgi:hypothetical protein